MSNTQSKARKVLDTIITLVDSAVIKAKFNRKKKGVVNALNGNGTANVNIGGIIYNDIKIRAGLSPLVGETIWVEIPNNDFSEAYIDTAKTVTGTGSTTDPNSHTHANKSLLDSLTQTMINTWNTVTNKQDKLNFTPENSANKGTANGYASLDNNAKIPLNQINDSILGQVEYKGIWDASTNTPTLPTTPSEKGIYYVCSVAGTQFSITFAVGDWIISNGISWDKVDNTDAVSSVAGRTGAIVLTKTDVGLSNVDNTSDANKPVSTAQQTALNAKLDKSSIKTTIADCTGVSDAPPSANLMAVTYDGLLGLMDGRYTASNASKLDGKVPSDYSLSTHGHTYDSLTGKPADDNFHNLTEVASFEDDDEILIFDVTDNTYKKIKKVNLGISSSGGGSSNLAMKSYEEEFTATDNQTVFNLTKGQYATNQDQISIILNGIVQPLSLITQTSPTSFTTNVPIPLGMKVLVKYYEIFSLVEVSAAMNLLNDKYIATSDGISSFAIPSSQYNALHDKLTIYYMGVKLDINDNYTLSGNTVNLTFTLNTNEKIDYEILKGVVLNNNISDVINQKADYKSGTGIFPANAPKFTFNDSFVTANTWIDIAPTQNKIGTWSVESFDGYFMITSDAIETTDVTFNWRGTK